MGMNFYAKKITNKETKQRLTNIIKDDMPTKKELYELINNGSIENVSQKLYDLWNNFSTTYDEENKSIHLGKRSGGWQFLWQFNDGKFYSDNLNSIKEFLNNPDYQIVDESGVVFTTEEFLNDEIGHCLYKTDDLWDLEHYWKVNPPVHDCMYSHLNDEWTSKDGLRFCKNYFS